MKKIIIAAILFILLSGCKVLKLYPIADGLIITQHFNSANPNIHEKDSFFLSIVISLYSKANKIDIIPDATGSKLEVQWNKFL